MSQQFDNEMRGVLFRNKDKQQGDKRPNAKGKIQINGVVYWLSSWTQTKDGEKYQQLRAERAEDRYQPQGAAPVVAPPPEEQTFGVIPGHDPDDIPF